LYSKTASAWPYRLIHCWRRAVDPTRTQARKQVKGWNANPLPHHIDKLFLICFGVAPFARLRAMINQLAEGIRVIRPQMQLRSDRRNRCCEIAEFTPGVSQIVKNAREFGLCVSACSTPSALRQARPSAVTPSPIVAGIGAVSVKQPR